MPDMKNRLNLNLSQAGFTIFEGLLIIIGVAIIGGTTFYVVSTTKNTRFNTASPDNEISKPIKEKEPERFRYKNFPLAGVKIRLTDEIKNVYFQERKLTDKSGQTVAIQYGNAGLEKINKECIEKNKAGVAVAEYQKQLADARFVTYIIKRNGSFDAVKQQAQIQLPESALKQFDTFYLYEPVNPTVCKGIKDHPAYQKELSSLNDIVLDAFGDAERL
jgi:hypothetical protein